MNRLNEVRVSEQHHRRHDRSRGVFDYGRGYGADHEQRKLNGPVLNKVESTWTFAFRKRDRDPVIIVSDESLAAQERGNELRISLVRLARLHAAVLRTTGSAEQAGDQDL